ncbi:dihydrofolate reductase family protein [Aquipuribacter hungaricus]|uniref:Dihydrofolate reductase family protein n=1 Tax=Aquipuribacter hungaricus TaxID=545624 RepID=A0ABV7WCP7_9MICO
MGRIVANFFISLDGVVERPDQWHFPYFDDEMGAVMGEGMQGQGAFLLGRRLYDEWSQYWPTNTDDDGFGPHINGIQKYVVSSTLTEATWQRTTLLTGADVAGQLREVKERTEGDIAMSGSATTVRWLLREGLLDELALLVHPVAVGHGQRLFEDTPTTPLRLLSSRALSSGVLHSRYAPA